MYMQTISEVWPDLYSPPTLAPDMGVRTWNSIDVPQFGQLPINTPTDARGMVFSASMAEACYGAKALELDIVFEHDAIDWVSGGTGYSDLVALKRTSDSYAGNGEMALIELVAYDTARANLFVGARAQEDQTISEIASWQDPEPLQSQGDGSTFKGVLTVLLDAHGQVIQAWVNGTALYFYGWADPYPDLGESAAWPGSKKLVKPDTLLYQPCPASFGCWLEGDPPGTSLGVYGPHIGTMAEFRVYRGARTSAARSAAWAEYATKWPVV